VAKEKAGTTNTNRYRSWKQNQANNW